MNRPVPGGVEERIAAAAELRSTRDPATGPEEHTMAETAEQNTTTTAPAETTAEDRSTTTNSIGGLRVEDRVAVTNEPPRGLAEEFRAAGFPGEIATLPFERFEERAVTRTGSVATMNSASSTAAGLGYDKRWIWPLFQRIERRVDDRHRAAGDYRISIRRYLNRRWGDRPVAAIRPTDVEQLRDDLMAAGLSPAPSSGTSPSLTGCSARRARSRPHPQPR